MPVPRGAAGGRHVCERLRLLGRTADRHEPLPGRQHAPGQGDHPSQTSVIGPDRHKYEVDSYIICVKPDGTAPCVAGTRQLTQVTVVVRDALKVTRSSRARPPCSTRPPAGKPRAGNGGVCRAMDTGAPKRTRPGSGTWTGRSGRARGQHLDLAKADAARVSTSAWPKRHGRGQAPGPGRSGHGPGSGPWTWPLGASRPRRA